MSRQDTGNAALLREAKTGIAAPAPVKQYQRVLNDAIKEAPAARKYEGLSSRGMFDDAKEAREFYERMLDIKESKGIYQMETFGSSTVGSKPAFPGKELWLHIQGKSGVYINAISSHPGTENEVLFGTEHQFKVKKYYEKDGKLHVDLEEIG